MMNNRIRMRHLRCFLALVKHRSVTKVAKELNTVQPSVSRTLKELEQELGMAVFQRTSHGLTLTPAGETLHGYVKNGMMQIDQGLGILAGEHHEQKVTLCALPNVVRILMPNVIAKFKEYYPEIDIRLNTTTTPLMMDGLRSGHLDFVVGRLMSPHLFKDLSFEHLYHEPLVFACRRDHPLAEKKAITIQDINHYEVIVPNPDTIIRTELDRFILSKGLPRFDNMIETISFEFSRNYIKISDAILCLPKGAIRQELDLGNVTLLDLFSQELMGSVGLTTLAEKNLTNPASLMRDMIRSEVSTQNLS